MKALESVGFENVNDNHKKRGVFLVKIGFCRVVHNKLLLITAKLPIINRFMSKQMNVVSIYDYWNEFRKLIFQIKKSNQNK